MIQAYTVNYIGGFSFVNFVIRLERVIEKMFYAPIIVKYYKRQMFKPFRKVIRLAILRNYFDKWNKPTINQIMIIWMPRWFIIIKIQQTLFLSLKNGADNS